MQLTVKNDGGSVMVDGVPVDGVTVQSQPKTVGDQLPQANEKEPVQVNTVSSTLDGVARNPAETPEKTTVPFYRQTWFWAVLILAALVAIWYFFIR